MLNLLLRKDRKNLKKEYTLRFFNILMIFAIAITAIFAVLLFSSHIFVWVEKGITQNQLSEIQGEEATKQRKEIEQINRKLISEFRTLRQTRPEYFEIINLIASQRPEGVGFSSIEIVPNFEEERLEIKVNGVSARRDNLLIFVELISQTENFEPVDLPLSSLTKEADIVFSLSLKSLALGVVEDSDVVEPEEETADSLPDNSEEENN
jgi:hypothetical protein